MYKLPLVCFPFIFLLFSCKNNSQARIDEKTDTTAINKRVPFVDTLSNNHIIVEALVNKKTVRLVLDNATHPDYYIILFKPSAARIGIIDTSKSFPLETDRINSTLFDISISGFNDPTRGVRVHNYHNLPASKLPDGLLGMGFLKKFVVFIDYQERYLRIIDTTDFSAPEGYNEIKFIPPYNGIFKKLEATFYINGTQFTAPVSLDLGNGLPGFSFGSFFYEKYKKVFDAASTGKQTESFAMISKTLNMDITLDSVSFYGYVIPEVSSLAAQSESGYSKTIIFGNNILRHFKKVYFHLGSNKMYIPL